MKRRNYDTTLFEDLKVKRVTKKKPCEYGTSCRYKHEYQHQLEFSHDNASIMGTSQSYSFENSTGHRLGRSSWSSNHGSSGYQQYNASTEPFYCSQCSTMIDITDFECHMIMHEGNRATDSLKHEQDDEYMNSILVDLENQYNQVQLVKRQKQQEQEDIEARDYAVALLESKALSDRAARELAVKNLLSEPDSTHPAADVVTLKLSIPTVEGGTTQVIRRFRASSPVQDLFNYLRTYEVLEGKSYIVRDSIATIVLEQKEERSFRDMHVLTHTSLIVVQTVEDTVDIDTCMSSYTTSTASIIDASSTLQQKHSSPVNSTGGSIGLPRARMGELIDLTLS